MSYVSLPFLLSNQRGLIWRNIRSCKSERREVCARLGMGLPGLVMCFSFFKEVAIKECVENTRQETGITKKILQRIKALWLSVRVLILDYVMLKEVTL